MSRCLGESVRHLGAEEDDDVEAELEEEGLDDLLLGLVILALPHRVDDNGVHDHSRPVETVRGVDLHKRDAQPSEHRTPSRPTCHDRG